MPLDIENLKEIAGALGTEVHQGPQGISYIGGTDAAGRHVRLIIRQPTPFFQTFEVAISDPKEGVTGRARLINGELTRNQEGVPVTLKVEGIGHDGLILGANSGATVYHPSQQASL